MNSPQTASTTRTTPPAEITVGAALEIAKLNQVMVPALIALCRLQCSNCNLPPEVMRRLADASEGEIANLCQIKVPVIGFSHTVCDQIRDSASVMARIAPPMSVQMPPELVLQGLITFANIARITLLAPLLLRLPSTVLRQMSEMAAKDFYAAARDTVCVFNIAPELLEDVLEGGRLSAFAVARMTASRPDLQH